jgi:hypothetical protein
MQKFIPILEALSERIILFSIAGAGIRWPIESSGQVNLTYSYNTEVSLEIKISIEESFARWTEVSPLNFREVEGNGIIRLFFNQNIQNVQGSLAQAHYPGTTEEAGDIMFTAAANTQSGAIFTHEIGHSLGLAHSDIREAVMYPVAHSSSGLHEDDIAGIRSLYGEGIGSVTHLPREVTQLNPHISPSMPIFPIPPPEIQFPGFEGKVEEGMADLDRDGLIDSIFLAQGSQGHLKAYLGSTGNESMSVLSFPGFYGNCALSAERDRIVVAAILPNTIHLKGYVDNLEVTSILVPT